MAELQFPNMYNAVQQGIADGRSQLATRLAGQAFIAPADQRQSALSQLAGVDPRAAMGMSDRFQAQDQAQQAQAKTQEVDHAKKLNGAANFMLQAVATKDPARIQGAWQAVSPYLAEISGKQPPAQFDPAMLPAMYKILGQTGGQTEQKLTVVGQGSTALGPDGSVAFSNPAAPANGQLVDIPDGQGGTVKMLFDPKTRQLSQPNYGGGQGQPTQPAVDPMQPYIDQANQAVKLGADPAKVDAWLAQQAQAGGLQPQAPGAMPAQPQGQGAPSQAPSHGLGYKPAKTMEMVSPAEAKQLGLPDGVVAQRGPDGTIHVVSKPTDNGEAGTNLLTPDGKRLMDAAIAHGYNMPMPNMGYGKEGTRAKADAINSLAARYKGANVNPDDAISMMIQGKTATGGLASVQRSAANISAWEASASKQADIALDMSNKVDRTGVPLFNKWILGGRQATGDVAVAQFNNTTNTLAEEYARVMGGGNAAATDSTRALAHSMLNSAQTQPQFAGVVAKMRQEMTARTEALHGVVMSQRQSATSNEGGNMGGWDGEAAPAAPAQAPQMQPTPVDFSHLW